MVSHISKFEVGDQILPLNIELVTKESLKRYADASGDPNLIHLNKEFAQKHGLPDVIAHGMLVMAYLGRMLTNTFPQSSLKDFSSKFISMTSINDELSCSGKIIERSEDNSGNIVYKVQLKVNNQNNEKRISGKASIIIYNTI